MKTKLTLKLKALENSETYIKKDESTAFKTICKLEDTGKPIQIVSDFAIKAGESVQADTYIELSYLVAKKENQKK